MVQLKAPAPISKRIQGIANECLGPKLYKMAKTVKIQSVRLLRAAGQLLQKISGKFSTKTRKKSTNVVSNCCQNRVLNKWRRESCVESSTTTLLLPVGTARLVLSPVKFDVPWRKRKFAGTLCDVCAVNTGSCISQLSAPGISRAALQQRTLPADDGVKLRHHFFFWSPAKLSSFSQELSTRRRPYGLLSRACN